MIKHFKISIVTSYLVFFMKVDFYINQEKV